MNRKPGIDFDLTIISIFKMWLESHHIEMVFSDADISEEELLDSRKIISEFFEIFPDNSKLRIFETSLMKYFGYCRFINTDKKKLLQSIYSF